MKSSVVVVFWYILCPRVDWSGYLACVATSHVEYVIAFGMIIMARIVSGEAFRGCGLAEEAEIDWPRMQVACTW